MKVSIKNRIYLSFFLLVFLFIVNGIASVITLNNSRKLAEHISKITDPSLEAIENFEDMLVDSKMYTTNWVFLRSSKEDKNALQKLQNYDYPQVKQKLNLLSSQWDDKAAADSLNKLYGSFEQILVFERKIMALLQKFDDYNDPVAKLESERILEDEVLPRTSSLMNTLVKVESAGQKIRLKKSSNLENSYVRLRTLISVLAITIICLGILLSFYMTRVIITPINKIRDIVNDLGKGILNKVNYEETKDEIGDMVHAVNNLSEKLQGTATFAYEIGKRNFNIPFEPLSDEDTLGKALIAMRDNLKSVDEALNEAQHIAHMGSWERELPDKLMWSDEMHRIFDVEQPHLNSSDQDYLSFIHPEDREYVIGLTKKYYQDHQPFSYECRIITRKGVTKDIYVLGNVVLNDDNEVIKTNGVIQDITARKKAEESLHKSEANLRTIFNNTDVSYVLLDSNLKILSFNQHANDRFQIQLLGSLVEGKNFIDCLTEDRKSISLERCKKVLQGEYINYETNFINSNGSLSWNYMRMFPVSDNAHKIHGMVMAMSDITIQKQSELQKEKITADLIQRNKDLEQFTYIVSHNLRAPVANIIGLSEMLTEEDLEDGMKKEFISGLAASSEKLDGVIMDLNHVLQVRNGLSENKTSVHLTDLVNDIISSISNIIEKEKAEINFDFTEVNKIVTIKSYLYSIFYNLITNSIKYRQADVNPVIKIRSCKHNNKTAIVFTDNGMGINLTKKREQIFGLYKRFHSHIEGKGLGLFMTKTQVEALGGIISLTSEVNKGTTFKIEFDI